MSEVVNAWDALELDSEFYADFDERSGSYGVFGLDSAFCYASYSDLETAKVKAESMNEGK